MSTLWQGHHAVLVRCELPRPFWCLRQAGVIRARVAHACLPHALLHTSRLCRSHPPR